MLKNAQAKYGVTLKTQKQCNSRKYTAELTIWNCSFHLDICCRCAPGACEWAARVLLRFLRTFWHWDHIVDVLNPMRNECVWICSSSCLDFFYGQINLKKLKNLVLFNVMFCFHWYGSQIHNLHTLCMSVICKCGCGVKNVISILISKLSKYLNEKEGIIKLICYNINISFY